MTSVIKYYEGILQYGLKLFTKDKHFEYVPGLILMK
jgi:hypothetical protein